MEQIRVVRSFIAADALAELVEAEYDFAGPITCKLFSKMLRTQDNDHYLITTADGEKLVIRVYQPGTRLERRESCYLYELDWLDFLRRQGRPVAYPIPRKDGRFLGQLIAPEGPRYYAVFSYAHGAPLSLQDEEQLYVMGQEIARIHLTSNAYEPPYHRPPLDLEFLLDRPVERIKRYWDEDAEHVEDLDFLLASAADAKQKLLELINNAESTPDSWRPIGGDFHNRSVFFDENNQPAFFNFDWCGLGWRAYDIAVFLHNTSLIHQDSPEPAEAFFAGYYSERPLSRNEHAAIDPFLTARRIWLTGWFMMNDGLAGHSFIAPL